MPARRKTLNDLIRDRSFAARRHPNRLVLAPIVHEPGLAELQQRYRAEASELERQQLALAFQRAMRAHGELIAIKLAAIAAMEPAEHNPERDRRASEREQRRNFARDAFLHGIRERQDEERRPWSVARIANVSASRRRPYAETSAG